MGETFAHMLSVWALEEPGSCTSLLPSLWWRTSCFSSAMCIPRLRYGIQKMVTVRKKTDFMSRHSGAASRSRLLQRPSVAFEGSQFQARGRLFYSRFIWFYPRTSS